MYRSRPPSPRRFRNPPAGPGRNRGIHALLLILEAGLEGLPQLHDDEIPIRAALARTRAERAATVRSPAGSFRSCAAVDALRFLPTAGDREFVVRGLVLSAILKRFDGPFLRVWNSLTYRLYASRRDPGNWIARRGLPHRAAPRCVSRIVGLGSDAVVFAGGAR